MNNKIDSNFAIAVIALVAACVGFAFWFERQSSEPYVIAPDTSRGTIEKRLPSSTEPEKQVIPQEKAVSVTNTAESADPVLVELSADALDANDTTTLEELDDLEISDLDLSDLDF